MDSQEVGRFWDANATAWAELARAGYDRYRDLINTPAFFAMLPQVRDLRGLDIGCGEGHNTRLLARRGARMEAFDVSETFVRYAGEAEAREPLGIRYQVADAHRMPFPDGTFDFATSFMCLMDMPEPERAIREAFRVLRPGGFLQFSITHPCFQTPLWKWVKDAQGNRLGVVCGQYFDHVDGRVDEWIFGAAPAEVKAKYAKFRIPRYDRTLTEWFRFLRAPGFTVEDLFEPSADAEALRRDPALADARCVAYFLILRARKPAAA